MTLQKINNCVTCPAHHTGNLTKLGIDLNFSDFVLALAGNPNTGKSTVFNRLTGLRQHTGNWPGKTVTRAEGAFIYEDFRYKVVDLPGTYSLLSTSTDEEIARNFILFGKPDVTIIVVDATRLERNLNLVLQILEITDRVVVCLNLMDEAKRHRLEINHRLLSKDLGVPVVPTVARQGEGMPGLLKAVHEVANGQFVCKPHRISSTVGKLKPALERLTSQIQARFPGLTNARWVALRMLDGDARIIEAVRSGELSQLGEIDPELEPTSAIA